jgi:hypothetical protein
MAKGQHKSNREKKKPKQDKKQTVPSSGSPFALAGAPVRPTQKSVAKKSR